MDEHLGWIAEAKEVAARCWLFQRLNPADIHGLLLKRGRVPKYMQAGFVQAGQTGVNYSPNDCCRLDAHAPPLNDTINVDQAGVQTYWRLGSCG